jgi:hypothetical protein
MSTAFLSSEQRDQLRKILSEEGNKALADLIKSYKSDLTSHFQTVWTPAKKNATFHMAGELFYKALQEELASSQRPIERSRFLEIWTQVVRQTLTNQPWLHLANPSEKEAMESHEIAAAQEWKIMKELAPYILIFMGVGIFIKIVVLYLGSHGYLNSSP